MAAAMAATFDSQLMDNYAATSNLPPVKEIAVAYDVDQGLIIFYVDKATSKFSLVYSNGQNGHYVTPMDLTAMLGLHGEVKSICLGQNSQSLQIYLVLAVEMTPGSGLCSLYVFAPGAPSDFKTDFTSKLLSTTTQHPLAVTDLSMSTVLNDTSYPFIAARVSGPVPSVQEVAVNIVQKTWSWSTNYPLPAHSSIVDTQFATIQGQPGMWVLDQQTNNGQPQFNLAFYFSSNGIVHQKTVATPAGISGESSLTVITNDKQLDELLVLGGGLHYFDSSSFIHDNSASKSISTHAMFDKTSDASTSQSGSDIYLWFQSHAITSQDNASLSFVQLSQADLLKAANTADLEPVPLTADYQLGKYVALAAPTTSQVHDQHIIYIADTGDTRVVTQSPSGSWSSPDTVTIPEPDGLTLLQTYTTHIVLPDAIGDADLFDVTITAADTTMMLLNGSKVTVGPNAPAELYVAPRGSVFIVTQTSDYTMPALTVKYSDSLPPLIIDPTQVTSQKLTALNSADKLKAATIPAEGGIQVKLLQGSTASDDDLTQAAQALQGLGLRSKEIEAGTAVATATAATSTVARSIIAPAASTHVPAAHRSEGFAIHLPQVHLPKVNLPPIHLPTVHLPPIHLPPVIANLPGDIDKDKGKLDHLLGKAGHEIVDIGNKAGDAIRSITIKIGNDVRQIAINTKHDVVKVAKVVLENIGVVWDHVKAFVGALFDWTKILEVQKEIHAGMSAVINYGRDRFDKAADALIAKIDTFFDEAESHLSGLDVIADKADPSFLSVPVNSNSPSSKLQSSAKMSMVSNALSSGDTSGQQATPPTSTVVKSPNVLQTFLDKAEKALENDKLMSALSGLTQDFRNATKPPVSMKKVIQVFKDVAKVILDLIQILIHDLLELAKTSIESLIEMVNEPMRIPIITPLITLISKGKVDAELPSPVSIMSFIMAIMIVEMTSVGILPEEHKPFDVTAALPTAYAADASVSKWISNTKATPAASVPATTTPTPSVSKLMANGASTHHATPGRELFAAQPNGHMKAEAVSATPAHQIKTQTSLKTSAPTSTWAEYSAVCSWGHPGVAGVHALFGIVRTSIFGQTYNAFSNLKKLPPVNGPLAIRAPVKETRNTQESNKSKVAIVDRLDVALSAFDIALACPPYDDIPAWEAGMVGYGFVGVAAIVHFISVLPSPAKLQTENSQLAFAIIDFVFSAIKTGLYAGSLGVQLDTSEDDWDQSYVTQHDEDMSKLALSSTGVQFFSAIGRLVGAIGDWNERKAAQQAGLDVPQDIGALLAVVIGSAVDTAGALADLGLDATRSHREHQYDKAAYRGISRK
ncbi:hypothetical protein MMC19_002197 [Ptychographa xylographoides]|nr:hypothetical protein [Ptychographa xylographoides]